MSKKKGKDGIRNPELLGGKNSLPQKAEGGVDIKKTIEMKQVEMQKPWVERVKPQQQQVQHKPSVLQQKAQEQLRVRKTQESKSEVSKTEVTQKQVVQKSVLQQKAQQVKSSASPKRVTVKAPPAKGRGK